MADTAKPKIFFPNLLIEMEKAGITQKKLGQAIKKDASAMSKRMDGSFDFTRPEMFAIQKLFPGCTLDYLFTAEEKKE